MEQVANAQKVNSKKVTPVLTMLSVGSANSWTLITMNALIAWITAMNAAPFGVVTIVPKLSSISMMIQLGWAHVYAKKV